MVEVTLGQQRAQSQGGTGCPSGHPGPRGDEGGSSDSVSDMGSPIMDHA